MTSRDDDDATRPVRPPEPQPPPDPLIGQRLQARYEVLQVLGKGGMATIYLARDLEIGQRVVLKVPRADLAREIGRDLQLLARFEREIDALAGLEHQNIVRIRGRGRVARGALELPFVVVDYKDGGDLSNRLRDLTESVEEVLRWLEPIADALDFVHDSGWLHRDIKPDNILFDRHGHVCLSDFGIAKKVIETGAETTIDTPFSTTQRSIIGTPGYIPPEAYEGSEITHAYDQYSLAVVAMQALSGERPPQRLTAATMRSILEQVAKEAREPIERALSHTPNERFASCGEFADALREASSGGFAVPWKLAGGAVGAAALIGAAAYFLPGLWTESPPPPPPPPDPTQPRVYELGSTAAETEQAVELCKQFQAGGRAAAGECAPSVYADEAPPRKLELSPFALDPHEITVAEFRTFLEANGSPPTQAEKLGRSFVPGEPIAEQGLSWRSPGWKEVRDDEPVVHVTRAEAAAYCASLDKRLPTADEWEAVARGSARRVFPWGEGWDDTRARWLASGAARRPAPVGKYAAAPEGYYDLAGNVWEWTATDEGGQAVVKGGSWAESNPANLRGAVKMVLDPTESSADVGFRCARSVASWPDASP